MLWRGNYNACELLCVRVYNLTKLYQDTPRQTAGNNREEEFRQKPAQTEEPNLPGNQDEKSSPVFFGLPKRADLLERCSSIKMFIR